MTTSEYLLDNRAAAAQRRFGALSALFDDVTFRHVEALGIQRGWRCWEVGAGGPSVPNWLAGRAGPEGRVLATDIDTSWIDGVAPTSRYGGMTSPAMTPAWCVRPDPRAPGADLDSPA